MKIIKLLLRLIYQGICFLFTFLYKGIKRLHVLFKFPHIIIFLYVSFLVFLISSLIINAYIYFYSKKYIIRNIQDIPNAYTGLVLGAGVVRGKYLSSVLRDRMIKSYQLYRNRKIKRFLLSGDHGTKYYDEVNSMKAYLLKKDVSSRDIFLDHAGFNTYDSVVRAKKIFQAMDIIIITQKFHLFRAIYIARKNNMKAYGYCADRRRYKYLNNYKLREVAANIKTFWEVLFKRKPKYLGETIPITGNSRKSWD